MRYCINTTSCLRLPLTSVRLQSTYMATLIGCSPRRPTKTSQLRRATVALQYAVITEHIVPLPRLYTMNHYPAI